MSVLSELGSNYKPASSTNITFPYKTGSVGNIYTPNFVNANNVVSGANTGILAASLTQGVYSIQGFIEILPGGGTLDAVTVNLEASNSAGDLTQLITFAGFMFGDPSYYIPVNFTFNALETQAAGSPNFTISVDGTTSGGATFNITQGTLNITKIA